jgi:calcineurin-like phosphoesterase family protein
LKKYLNAFFISDTHFSHRNILTSGFGTRDFATIEEHDEYLVKVWNETVGVNDRVYLLGDVAFQSKFEVLARLNGSLTLVLGNHDYPSKIAKIQEVRPDIRIAGCIVDSDLIISHIPVHPDCLGDRAEFNIHGHLHNGKLDDPRYINCSVEQLEGYRPTKLKDLLP